MPRAIAELIDNHDDNNNYSDNEPIVIGRAGDLWQRVPEDPENQGPQHRPDHRAATARQAGPADDRRRDDIQLVARGEIRLGLPLNERQHHA